MHRRRELDRCRSTRSPVLIADSEMGVTDVTNDLIVPQDRRAFGEETVILTIAKQLLFPTVDRVTTG